MQIGKYYTFMSKNRSLLDQDTDLANRYRTEPTGYGSCKPCDKAGDVSPDDADDGAAAGDNDEAGESLGDVRRHQVGLLNFHVGLEHVVEHHRHRVIQQRLTEDDNVEDLVDLINKRDK